MRTEYVNPAEAPGRPRLPVRRCGCGGCRKLFQPHRRDNRFCSNSCRSQASRDRKVGSEAFGEEPAVMSGPEVDVMEPEGGEVKTAVEDMFPAAPGFIPVVIRGEETVGKAESAPAAAVTSGLELAFASGCVLRVGPQVEERSLRLMLRVLREEGLC